MPGLSHVPGPDCMWLELMPTGLQAQLMHTPEVPLILLVAHLALTQVVLHHQQIIPVLTILVIDPWIRTETRLAFDLARTRDTQ